MILIISSKDDISTNDVIDWLRNKKVEYLRISSDDDVLVHDVIIDNKKQDALIEIREVKYWLSTFSSIWYRRSWVSIHRILYNSKVNNQFSDEINEQLISEIFYLSDFIDNYFMEKMLSRRSDVTLNKLTTLQIASDFGLKIPESRIISRKNILLNFLQNNRLITKNFSPGVFVRYNQSFLNGYTIEVTKNMVNKLSNKFHPMLFQTLIDKSFEIRSFYLNGQFYSTAIFSQNDEKTKLDFRNYNYSKPNRTPPFNLPKEIKNKLISTMDKLKLNTGSIDLLVTPKGEYIFLEVNPIGQFSQVSRPGNYNLEEKIADSLINNYHERSKKNKN